jgi:hypothetical protein
MPYSATGAALGRSMGLSGFWDDVYKVGSGIAQAADTVRSVRSGRSQVIVAPSPLVNAAQAVQSNMGWIVPVAIGLGAFFLLRKRR